ncbi:MAG: tRNA pseudouridine(13) synthase TruD [bacterium]|nr:tRNA pseudouridine(13) synthase TruD [bacterium]
MITNEQREQERELLQEEKKQNPQLFERLPSVDSTEALSWIGIHGVLGEYPPAYIKYLPQDFVVEEISLEKSIHTVEKGDLWKTQEVSSLPVRGELVKMDCSTLEAKDELVSQISSSPAVIGFAGIKDRFALTSQAISFQNVSDAGAFSRLHNERWFLKNLERKKGMIQNGALWGNRFLVALRTPQEIKEKEQERIKSTLKEVEKEGFWNFFSFQRFGTPRLNSHIAGKILFQGDYKEAVKSFCTFRSDREIPYFRSFRDHIEADWGNWETIYKRISPFPSNFPSELAMVGHLCRHPDDFLGALKTIPDQVRLWVYAYASYLFNKKLSNSIQEGDVSYELPFITSHNPRDWEAYQEFLQEDGIRMPSRISKDFPFVTFASRATPVLQKAEVHGIHFENKIAVIAFSLQKGCYAASFLAHLFQLASHLPILPGIDTTPIDVKNVLGLGSLDETLEYFQPLIARMEKDRDSQEEV